MTGPLSEATLAQVKASHPNRSSWVSANAGSGKTRVLTDRVARLLLRGTKPQRILCLTYTKAAAAEMQNRLFKRLGAWAMMEDDALRDALTAIGEQGAAYAPEALDRARTLFAAALETPGGLKIQTIHAFCGYLLRRFPLEAGVSPQFTEIDEGQATALRADVLADMAEDGPEIDALARHLSSDMSLDSLLMDIQKQRDAFGQLDRDALAATLGIMPDLTEADVLAELEEHASRDDVRRLAVIMADGGVNEQKRAAILNTLTPQTDSHAYLTCLRSAFLTKTGQPLKAPLTKAVKNAHQWAEELVADITDVILGTTDRLNAVRMLARSEDLHHFASAYLARYRDAKAARGALDFDDLIDRTRDLLTAHETTQWVLYRIDGGIEHILVDEAQDTSPRQWEVIEALSRAFTEHQPGERTIFVVGDKKQSIYGFQGADPSQFGIKQTQIGARLEEAGDGLQVTGLEYSFRSARPVLELVDKVFADDATGALDGAPVHRFFDVKPGRVDIWPYQAKEGRAEEGEWYDPVDTIAPDDPVMKLARDLASDISDKVARREPIPDGEGGWRPVRPGDFLVLVRSRTAFFHALIAALKAKQVPVAGADRLKITDEIAVKDLLSLLRFLDNERDDLSLAEALRSPLMGVTEAQLFQLAAGRDGTLWQALRRTGPPEVTARLEALRNRVDFDRPHELLEAALTTQGGRERLIARLGAECLDAVDELLTQALAYEQGALPSLSGFLAWIDNREIVVKRDMDAGADEVRVMTVHGSKGLEAPVVIVADVAKFSPARNKPGVAICDDRPFWTTAKGDTPAALTPVEEARQAEEWREFSRLLYVALTRAENWLIVCGAGDNPDADGRWFGKVEAAARALAGPMEVGLPVALRHRWTPGDVPTDSTAPGTPSPAPRLAAPSAPPQKAKAISPSDHGAAHALHGEYGDGYDAEAAKARGTLIHTMLDRLAEIPEAERPARAALFDGGAEVADEVLAVLSAPTLAEIFAPGTMSEVPVSARLDVARGEEVFGRIDRLVITPDKVLAVDFKSNRIVPDTPDAIPKGIIVQMNLYRAALAQVFPGHTVETAIVWTRNAALMAVPHMDVSDALALFQSLDQNGAAS